jgi:hypothetical protein
MRKLAVIHFSPIEMYPPVMNWLDYLAAQGENWDVRVFTLEDFGRPLPFTPRSPDIKIYRPALVDRTPGSWRKKFLYAYLNYFFFYLATLLRLIVFRPDAILYYETQSSFPAIVYKRFFRKRVRLFIHYHEYVSPQEYAAGMALNRRGHSLEKKIYPRTEGISQTNAYRIQLFKQDNAGITLPEMYSLPNYPPAAWQEFRRGPGEPGASAATEPAASTATEPAAAASAATAPASSIKVVYVGALSLETMYVREFAQWVIAQHGRVSWDVYSDNFTPEAAEYLRTAGKDSIAFKAGVEYFDLPKILMGYDVGVVLYKGHIPNYIYNAPNKLFEYLACGLDVWFPKVMLGALDLVTHETFPKVVPLDFENLGNFGLAAAVNRSGLRQEAGRFSCEQALEPLLKRLKE